jgi:hypothetical protein
MPATSLEELLKTSLEGVNRAFQDADQALHAEVASASDALSKISDGTIQVKLEPAAESQDGAITYSFVVDKEKTTRDRLGWFRVTPKGYPILYSQNQMYLETGPRESISDGPKLKAFFHQMASNPDSSLIQKVAYLMRKKQDSTSASPS